MEFIRNLTDIELKENQTAKFECELNKSEVSVKWFRNGEPINPDDKNVTIKSDGKVHSLTLKKVDASHAAKYTVKTVGPSSSGSLYVEEIPVEFLVKLKDVKVKEKETAVFTCELNKENAPVKWFKSGTEIFSNDIKFKFVVDGSKYSLKIFDCELEDKNDYTISYRNKKSTANLEVEGSIVILIINFFFNDLIFLS